MHDPETLAFAIRSLRKDRHGYRRHLIDVWHVEPGGRDSGEVCKHYIRTEPEGDGVAVKVTYLRGWRWHVHHWKINVLPLMRLRTLLVDRCAWCHGRHTKSNPVNCSVGWYSTRTHWWTTKQGIYHSDCHSAWKARLSCSCAEPIDTGRWSSCAQCGLKRYDMDALQREANRCLIEMVPEGAAPHREVMNLVGNLWAVRRAQKETSA